MLNTKIQRLPSTSPELPALRPSGSNPGVDTSSIAEGAGAFAQGLERAAQSFRAADDEIQAQQRTADVAAADASWVKSSLGINTEFERSTDLKDWDTRATDATTKALGTAATLIRDPKTRAAWEASTELKRLTATQAIKDYGYEMGRSRDRASLEASVTDLAKAYADPSVPDVTREAARKSITASIDVAEKSGLITADAASKLRDVGLDKASAAYAMNLGELGIEFGDPEKVLRDLAIPGANPGHGSIAEPYKSLSFDQRLALGERAKAKMDQNDVSLRAGIETVKDDAPAAISNTGVYDGEMPTIDDFKKAYGTGQGQVQFDAFVDSVDVAHKTYGFRTAPADQILKAVEASTPKSTGPGAALESKKFEVLSRAADTTLKARKEDPAGYVMEAFPNVKASFDAASEDPAKFDDALTMMATAQMHLGMDTMVLLPKGMAADAVAKFKDTTLPADERVSALLGPVLRTNNEIRQRQIYDQLVDAGVPSYTRGAVAAMARGDSAGASNLMRAVMIDPKDMAGALPNDITDAKINAGVQDQLLDPGQIGDVTYGISDGSTDNFQRVVDDSTLIARDVRLHLLDGSANGDLDQAIALTSKDMYGDVQVVTGDGVKITLPKGEDPEPVKQGLGQLQIHAETELRNALTAGIGAFDPASGMQAIVTAGVDNYVQQVMDQGYFVNAGEDAYQFLNPFTGAVIGDADGKPLTFTKAEALANVPKFIPDAYGQHS